MNALVWLLFTVIDIYTWVVIGSVIMSWLLAFNVINRSNQFVYMASDFLYRATEPVLGRIRRFLPSLGGIDISPLVLLIALIFIKRLIVDMLSA